MNEWFNVTKIHGYLVWLCPKSDSRIMNEFLLSFRKVQIDMRVYIENDAKSVKDSLPKLPFDFWSLNLSFGQYWSHFFFVNKMYWFVCVRWMKLNIHLISDSLFLVTTKFILIDIETNLYMRKWLELMTFNRCPQRLAFGTL